MQPIHEAVSRSSEIGDSSDSMDVQKASSQSLNDTSSESFVDEEKTNSTEGIQTAIDEAISYIEVSQELWQKGELENALEALDQAYALLLKLEHNDDPKLIQQKEDLRYMISKRILEIYASRHIVASGNHKAIPLEMNRYVQAEIKSFTVGAEKNFFIESYQRSGLYRSHIIKTLEEAGLPVELSWLPLIESGFKAQALSKARALGLWQFISSTGYKYGLKRSTYIDERLDPFKATKAAMEYLKELHQIFGDWSTALAAYNCGEGRVLRLISTQNINYLDNFWDLYERLPAETSRYVPRFLATLHIINNPKQYGLDKIEVMEPLDFETVSISRQVHLNEIAKEIDESEKTLALLNPELRYSILPNEDYMLRVPPNKGETLMAMIEKIPISYPPRDKKPVSTSSRKTYIKHKVRSGETLSTIAKKYRVSVSSILRANNIRKKNVISAGRILKIPRNGKNIRSASQESSSPENDSASEFITYTVKKGDSLWNLARRFGTTANNIIAANNLSKANLHIGQRIKVQASASVTSNEPTGDKEFKTYFVAADDNPFKIAQKHNMPLEKLLRINNMSPNHKIFPGQSLLVE